MVGIRARVAHRWRRRGLLCAPQPIDVLFEFGDALLALWQPASG